MGIPTVVGILGPSIASLRVVFRALLSTQPWLHDPDTLPLPYRHEAEIGQEKHSKLTIGILMTDGVVTPHPPISRAVREVQMALEAAGHEVISVTVQ